MLDELFRAAPRSDAMSVIAVGGYGRGELSPHSDVDLVVLCRDTSKPPTATLRALLYPLWDAGFEVGHAFERPVDTIDRAHNDLRTATSILTARHVTGTPELFDELLDRRRRWLAAEGRHVVRRILQNTTERHARVERGGWALAPDLKDDVGGLRDAHTVGWLAAVVNEPMPEDVAMEAERLLAVREALHAEVKRKLDRIRIDLQPAVARNLGIEGARSADALMKIVHATARSIEHRCRVTMDGLANKVLNVPKRSGSVRPIDAGVRIEDGVVVSEAIRDVAGAVRLLAAVAETGRPISRATLSDLRRCFDRAPLDRWDDGVREAFVELLKAPHATPALELIDQLDAWRVLLPEWLSIRALAQHDPYHRYTVDAHSFVCVEEVTRALEGDPVARRAGKEAGELGPLYLAALLHDIGKGSGEDHSLAGERLARAVCARIGLPRGELHEVASLVRHHLLLADTATRRDLDDGAVIESVAKAIATPRALRLLYVLTVADARATGPDAWSNWKSALVRELYRKALVALETGRLPTRSDVAARSREVEAYEPSLAGRVEPILSTLPPSYMGSVSVAEMADEIRILLRPPESGEVRYRIDDATERGHAVLTVCFRDAPGSLARTAGVVTLNGLSVLRAQAYSATTGLAVERFVLRDPGGGRWERLPAHLEAAFSGHLALEARLHRKARDHRPPRAPVPEVRVLQDASDDSSVVEVRATDALGLLYAIASGIADLDLNIHTAKIDTLGQRVVDVFYVRTVRGTKLSDRQAAELPRAIRHRVRALLGE